MALLRPHVGTHYESRHEAVKAALKVLEPQQQIFEISGPHLLYIYTYSFYTIDSRIFLSAMMLD
jgi:hypothetical protein